MLINIHFAFNVSPQKIVHFCHVRRSSRPCDVADMWTSSSNSSSWEVFFQPLAHICTPVWRCSILHEHELIWILEFTKMTYVWIEFLALRYNLPFTLFSKIKRPMIPAIPTAAHTVILEKFNGFKIVQWGLTLAQCQSSVNWFLHLSGNWLHQRALKVWSS